MSYSIAAESGSLLAAYQLGYMYYHGVGVKQNDLLAVKYFELATNSPLAYRPHGLSLTSWYLAESYNNLGIIYQYGYGTKQDVKMAIKMYKEGEKFGSINAKANLGTVYSEAINITRKPLVKLTNN